MNKNLLTMPALFIVAFCSFSSLFASSPFDVFDKYDRERDRVREKMERDSQRRQDKWDREWAQSQWETEQWHRDVRAEWDKKARSKKEKKRIKKQKQKELEMKNSDNEFIQKVMKDYEVSKHSEYISYVLTSDLPEKTKDKIINHFNYMYQKANP